jgi:hypothetical protein
MRRARRKRSEGTGQRSKQADRDQKQPPPLVRGASAHFDGTSPCRRTIAVVAVHAERGAERDEISMNRC